MLESLYLSSIISLIMLIWFKSEALIEWSYLFGVSDFFKHKEFNEEKVNAFMDNRSLNYPEFLKNKYDNFFTRLINCPLCLSVWLSFFFTFTSSILFFTPSILLLMPPVCITSLILYGLVASLIKYSS